jgi:hypothetical protein
MEERQIPDEMLDALSSLMKGAMYFKDKNPMMSETIMFFCAKTVGAEFDYNYEFTKAFGSCDCAEQNAKNGPDEVVGCSACPSKTPPTVVPEKRSCNCGDDPVERCPQCPEPVKKFADRNPDGSLKYIPETKPAPQVAAYLQVSGHEGVTSNTWINKEARIKGPMVRLTKEQDAECENEVNAIIAYVKEQLSQTK